MQQEPTLMELRANIQRHMQQRSPFLHGLVDLVLMQIMLRFGEREMHRAIVDFGLEKYGW